MERVVFVAEERIFLDGRVRLEQLVDHLVDHAPRRRAVDCRNLLQCAHIIVDDCLTRDREHAPVGCDACFCHALCDAARLELAALVQLFERIRFTQAVAHRVLEVRVAPMCRPELIRRRRGLIRLCHALMRNVREDARECTRARQCLADNRFIVHHARILPQFALHALSGKSNHALPAILIRTFRLVLDRKPCTHGKTIRRRRAELVHLINLHRHRLSLAFGGELVEDCRTDSLDAHTVIDVWRIIHAELTAHRPDLTHAGTLLGDCRLTCRLRIRLHARIRRYRYGSLCLYSIVLVLFVHRCLSIL